MASSAHGLLQNPAAPPRQAPDLAFLSGEWQQWPLFVPVAIGLGIALWFGLPTLGLRRAALLVVFGLALLGLSLRGPARPALAGAACLIALGLLAADLRSLSVAAPRLHHRVGPVSIEGLVESVEARAGGTAARLIVARPRPDGAAPDRFAIVLRAPAPPDITPGTRISLEAMLSPHAGPAAPGSYHPARRAWFEGIAASGIAIGPPVLLVPAPDRSHPLQAVRAKIDNSLAASLGPSHGPLSAALVTGSQGGVPQPLIDAMRASGLAHLLTVSGFHIGVATGFAFFLARRLLLLWPALALRLPTRALAAAVAMVAAWAYVLLSGAEVPAVRAGLTATIVLLAVALGRDPFSLRLIAAAAAAILLARPEALLTPSFQLSFAAVTAIVLLLNNATVASRLSRAPGDGLPIRFLKAAALLVLTSLVAELVLTPIAAAHFGRAGAYGVAANLAAIPLVSFLVLPLIALHLAGTIIGLASLTAPPLALALDAFVLIATRVSLMPGATLAIPAVSPLAFGLGIAGALLLGLLATRARLLGLPLLAAALLLHLLAPRPDLFISEDSRQVGIVAPDGRLFIARGTGESQVVRAWLSAAAARGAAPLAGHPGAHCSEGGCAVRLASGLGLLVFRDEPGPADPSVARACAAADLVVAPALPPGCTPRWAAFDAASLAPAGALAIQSGRRKVIPAAGPRSDHPWHPAALPGSVPSLLSAPGWMDPIAE